MMAAPKLIPVYPARAPLVRSRKLTSPEVEVKFDAPPIDIPRALVGPDALRGVAVRSGQHCAHPLLAWFGVSATCRASLAFYNTHEEIERFVVALNKVRRLLG